MEELCKDEKSRMKTTAPENVYELIQKRLKIIFDEFDNIYVSFSGGKDSGVLLNLCIEYMRKNKLNRKIGVFHMDYEAQYQMTTDYVDRTLAQNRDIIEVYRVCVPFKVTTCASMYQEYWRPWDEEKRRLWVRERPLECLVGEDFPFYKRDMWDYEFQIKFAEWYHKKKDAVRTCCLVGIRTQESLNRWRSIYGSNRFNSYRRLQWMRKLHPDVYNSYPIHDWKTTDIWTANGKFHWDYNEIYDLYYKAGVPLERQRVASPFISAAQETLKLYKAIDPDMWGKMLGRVNGVNFTGLYGGTKAMGWQSIKLPTGYTWERYMYFLLDTLPLNVRRNYLSKLAVSIDFWKTKGGCLSMDTVRKLREAGVECYVEKSTNYKTDKLPVKMDYLDDISIPEFREIPTYKRMCICIMKNDHACKYMGFALNKSEKERRERVLQKYKNILE